MIVERHPVRTRPMRLALAAVMIVAAGGEGWADEDPSRLVQKTLQAWVAGHYIKDKCPRYRPNIAFITKVMDSVGVRFEDLDGKYASFIRVTRDSIDQHQGLTQDEYCDFLFDTYQATGQDQHAIERR